VASSLPSSARAFLAALAALAAAPRCASALDPAPECVAPAEPGGGFELTCRLVLAGLAAPGTGRPPGRITFVPGGVGAVAYESIVTQRAREPDTLVAFSSGSLLNLAQGKFSNHSARDVRWVAAFALDYGVMAVRADSRFRSLRELVTGLRADPRKVVFGIGGTLGGQDWTKAALLARASGVEPGRIRYVSFEGGGEALVALEAGLVDVVPGDLAEASERAARGSIRLLAVLADARLPGRHATLPTARELGFAVSWPTIRGVYMGLKVADADHLRWVKTFDRLLASDAFAAARDALGLLPFSSTGPALDALVEKTVREYAALARELDPANR
jgi:putative tricarboxylic transport membrane protein